MLSDKKKDIRREANNTLKELLKELKEQPRNKVQFGELVSILIPSCTSAGTFLSSTPRPPLPTPLLCSAQVTGTM